MGTAFRHLALIQVMWVGAAMMLGLSASADARQLGLGVGASQTLYYPGDQLRLSISAANVSGVGAADFYTGLILPDGITIATIGSGTVRLGTLANPAAFVPVATGVGLGSPFAASVDPLFAYVWTGGEPVGSYTIFLVAVRAGGFADNRIDGGDILALQTGGLHLRPRGQVVVNSGAVVSTQITPEAGGTLSLPGPGGAAVTLTLPAGAVDEPTTISGTPITSATGLPLDRLLGAVRFAPDGLRLSEPATLTMTLPASVRPLGTVGFTMKDDGSGFETIPVTVANGVATMQIAHFSSSGFGQSVCGPTVTTAVGRDACREMAERLAEAAAIVAAGSGGTPLPVRVLLAAELRTELQRWLEGLESQVRINVTDEIATAHYLFMVGLRELDAIRAILELVTALDIGAVSLPLLTTLEQQVPSGIDFLRSQDNRECLANKPASRDWLRRLFELAGESRERGLPVSGSTHGITCVVLNVEVTLAAVVPPTGAPLAVAAAVRFSDFSELPDHPVVALEVVAGSTSIVANPTFAQGENVAGLNTTVAPPNPSSSGLSFQIRADVPELGLSKRQTVRRGQSISTVTRTINVSATATAGTDTVTSNRTGTDVLNVGITADDPDPQGGRAFASTHASTAVDAQKTNWSMEGSLRSLTDGGPTSARVFLTNEMAAELVGSFSCRIDVQTEFEVNEAVIPLLIVTLSRNGVTVFNATNVANRTLPCGDGHYVLNVVSSTSSSAGRGDDTSAMRNYNVTLGLTPVDGDATRATKR